MIQHDSSYLDAQDADGTLEAVSRFPATACQVRYWRTQSDLPRSSMLNVSYRLAVRGSFDPQGLERSLRRLMQRHEILRTAFRLENGTLFQIVAEDPPMAFTAHDLRPLEPATRAAEGERIGREEARKPFDLSASSFMRAVWLRTAPAGGELLLTFHLLVLDGWSFAILVRELIGFLEAEAGGAAATLEPVDLHHGDYAMWKQALLASDAIAPSRDFWQKELVGYQRFEVTPDHVRSVTRARDSHIASRLLPAPTTEKLLARSRTDGVTLFTQACAALSLALSAREGGREVILGTQVSTRDQKELESIIGPLSNSVVLRIPAPGHLSQRQLLDLCAEKTSQAITHGQVPLDELANMAGVSHDPARPPLYAVNITLQQSFVGMGDEVAAPHVSAELLRSYEVGALYDLSFFMVARPEGWRISCDGDTGLYSVATLEQLLTAWEAALGGIAEGDGQAAKAPYLSRIPALEPSPATRAELEAKLDRVITYHPESPGTPVIFLNNTAVLYDLSERLHPQRPLIDVPMVPAGGPRTLPDRAFEDIATDTLRLVRAVRPAGPYILMGHCVLGSLCIEIAKQLQAQGETVELVVLNDSWVPGYREDMTWLDRLLRRLQVQAYYLPKDFARWRRKEISLLQYLGQYRISHALGLISAGLRLGLLRGDPTEYAVPENRWYTDYLLRQQSRYRPVTYPGDVQIFRSQEPRKGRLFAYDFGWGAVASGRLDVHEIPTMHDTMFRPEGAAVIGDAINRRLAGSLIRPTD